ncbi:MFS permease protein [Klebsiella pneumoniae IS39]|nr:MFS permease protein [Klebsiella pneumoniae IS39]
MGAALVTLSFALMFMLPLLPVHAQLALIALSAIGFDLGLQSSLVAHQNLVYGLEPQARGRLNALLFTVVFIGMSLGSVLGSKLYVLAGWNGVVTLAVITGALALAIRLLENARILAAERSAYIKNPLRLRRSGVFLPTQPLTPCDGQTLSRGSPAPAAWRNRLPPRR